MGRHVPLLDVVAEGQQQLGETVALTRTHVVAQREVDAELVRDVAHAEAERVELAAAVAGRPMIVAVTPSHGIRGVLTQAGPLLHPDAIVVNAAKCLLPLKSGASVTVVVPRKGQGSCSFGA